MRRLAQTRKVGHLGTLDPAATGVLPLVIGRATRLARFYASSDKVYDAVLRFGWATSTYDREGERVGEPSEVDLDRDRLEPLLERFRGEFEQTPPPVSAKKIHGTPAYKLARKNVAVELEPVKVKVFSLELVGCSGAEARLRVHCSAGTYLRGIAHDLGQAYGCGAFLLSLVRTRSAEFTIEQARTLDALAEMAAADKLSEALVPATSLLPDVPFERVDNLTETQIRQGRDFRTSPFRSGEPPRYVKAVSQQNELIAIGEIRLPNLYHPFIVL